MGVTVIACRERDHVFQKIRTLVRGRGVRGFHECRHCGSAVDGQADECPDCGAAEIAHILL